MLIQVLRWSAVILAAIALVFALRWPRKFPYRITVVLGCLAALAIAGSPLAFGPDAVLTFAGNLVGLVLVVASCWTVLRYRDF